MTEQNDIKVSCVIPAFNAAGCVGRAIDSVLGQTLGVYEIIVVDDGSTDETGKVVQSYGEKVNYIRQENAGVSVARNTAIQAATGNWIAFLDADDQWLEQKNAIQTEIIKQNPDLRWCAANYIISKGGKRQILGNEELMRKALKGRSFYENYFVASTTGGCYAHTQTMMIRKDVFDEVGFFEPGKQRLEDLDVWWKIGYRYPKIGYTHEPLTIMHLEEHDPSLVYFRMQEKRGVEIRELATRHLPMAEQFGVSNVFKPFLAKQLKGRMRSMLFNGFGDDARDTVRRFKKLFPWYLRWGVLSLTVFPKLTSAGMRSISAGKRWLKLNRHVTRHYSQADVDKHVEK